MPPQELPHLGVDYRIISKATRYELMVPPFVPEIDVRPKPEGLGTPWLLLPADIGYRIDSWAGDPRQGSIAMPNVRFTSTRRTRGPTRNGDCYRTAKVTGSSLTWLPASR
jgi:hypothetical protein